MIISPSESVFAISAIHPVKLTRTLIDLRNSVFNPVFKVGEIKILNLGGLHRKPFSQQASRLPHRLRVGADETGGENGLDLGHFAEVQFLNVLGVIFSSASSVIRMISCRMESPGAMRCASS
ncbi:hypothetical protein [Paraburkholderia fungorum]|uniref:hypothetical protein n=1 Tax=Paraburkholderia fungorum TaxID=134537 RepID=UPI00402B124E